MTNCLQTLFYDEQHYFACITANMEAFYVKIHLYKYKTTYSKMFARHIHAFLLIYCITPRESSGRFFFGPPGIYNFYSPNNGSKKIQKYAPEIISHTRSRMSVYVQDSSCAILHNKQIMTNEQAIMKKN